MTSVPVRPGSFRHKGRRIVFTEYGEGSRVTVLVHGLLLAQTMQAPLARALAERGNRVVTVDLLGHGRSERPDDMGVYSMQFFAEQVVALLDHLKVEEAVVGGTSLGANVTLEVASLAPERLRGMVVEMPVLDNALLACALVFTPLMVGLTFGAPLARATAAAARLVPRGPLPNLARIGLDWISQDPEPGAAVLQGLFFGRIAPHRTERSTFDMPTLILGHHRDPIHPFSDADALVRELPDARMLEADSFFELRMSPERLTGEIVAFVDECWRPRRTSGARRATA
jgi:pimeloyl-ACP methyl ester carboxylesterase